MADTSFIIRKPENKSSAENHDQIDINLIEWKNYDDKICHQCGQVHGNELTAGSTIQDMISFLDRNRSENI
jgi:acetone carboxylase gamma subunit